MATKTKKTTDAWPKIVTGSHLTVTTYEDGRTELEWDHEALLRDVRDAVENYEESQSKPKRTRKKKGE
jgi:hypothetical protein